jgi:peptide deformylase
MAIREIITDLEKLDKIAEGIDLRKEFNTIGRTAILDLKHTIQAYNLVALTAPQIDIDKRIICINFNGTIRTFCNPIMGNGKGYTLSRESCPSIPGKEYIRLRFGDIQLFYQTPMGKPESVVLKGRAACVAQYALDMLDGLTLADVALPILEGWDELAEEDRAEIINDYLESLDMKKQELEKAISEDEEASKVLDAVKFINAVNSGEVTLEGITAEEEVPESIEE